MTTSERFDFRNSAGQTLTGRLELPLRPTAFAIFAHCFTCSKNVKAASRISRGLARQGIAVLRFDFTGLGNSEGDFSNTNFSSNVEDLVSAADELRVQFEAPQLLIGHSLGGTAALMAARRIEEIKAVATIGSPADPEHVIKLFGNQVSEIEAQGDYQVSLAGRPFTIRKQLLDDLRSTSLKNSLPTLNKAVAIYHSPQDELVSIDQAKMIYDSLKHPKSFISLDGADHLLTDDADAEFVSVTLAAWAKRYLSSTAHPSTLPEEGAVLVEEISGFTQRVATSNHEILADEPGSVGGSDLGMTPYDLLLSALGTCTSMTLRMYADRKEWAVEGIAVELKHDRIHEKDCESCEDQGGQVDRIQRIIRVRGDLSEVQRVRLQEIADRCPVHKTLMNKKQIVTELTLETGSPQPANS